MPLKLEVLASGDAGPRRRFNFAMKDFVEARIGRSIDWRDFSILVRDPKTQAVKGGLWGHSAVDFMHVDLVFLDESARGQGIGTKLMRKAEAEARRRRCTGIWLDSFSFHAPDFYRKLGYGEFGRLEDRPLGHTQYFFLKRLDQASRRRSGRRA